MYQAWRVRFSQLLLLLIIIFSTRFSFAAPQYNFIPSGHDGGGGQSCIAADPFHPGTIISGGDIWGLWRSTNYGADFQAVSLPVSGDSFFSGAFNFKIAAVKFSLKTQNRVYAAVGNKGASGGFLRSDDGGLTWSRKSTVPQFAGQVHINDSASHPRSVGNLIALDATQTNEYVYVGTYDQGVMRSTGTDPGASWATITLPGLTTPYIRGIALDDTNAQTLYVGCYDNDGDGTNESIYKITNARTATQATLITNPNFKQAEELVVVNGVLYVAANDATTSKRGIWRYNGSAWAQIYSDSGATEWYSIDGYWTGSNAVIYAGSTDTSKSEGNNLYRSVIRSNNAQAATPSWAYLTKSTSRIYPNMPMAGPLGNGDYTSDTWWHSDDIRHCIGGGTFVCCQTLIDPSDATHKRVYVCGRAGLWRTDDGSVSDPYWYPCMRHMNATVCIDVAADPNNANRAYTTDGDWSFLYSTDKFDHMICEATSIGSPTEFRYRKLAIDSTTDPGSPSPVYMAGGGGVAYNANPPAAGNNWISTGLSVSDEVMSVAVKYIPGTGTVCLAAVNNGGIYRKVGAGNNGTWSMVYNGGSVMTGLDVSNRCSTFSWAGGTSGEVYFTDRDNGVYRSLNAGASGSWIKVTAPAGGWANTGGSIRKYTGCAAVNPLNASQCYVTSTEGVFYSGNADDPSPSFSPVTISGMQTPGMCAYDDAGGIYVISLVNGATRGRLFYKAAGGSWAEISTNDTYKAQCGLPMSIAVGPGPEHRLYFALDFMGNCVGVSADTTPPGPVTNLQATPAGDHIDLTWTNPTDSDFAGVITSRSTDGYPQDPNGSDGYIYDRGNVTSADILNVPAGELTYISVFTYDASGNTRTTPVSVSEYSAPAAVTNLNAVADPAGNKVNLSWTNPTGDYNATTVRRATGSYPATPTDGTSVYEGTGTSKSDTGLTDGTQYYYSVWAHDSYSNYSPVAQITCTPADTTSPAAPTNFTATPGNGQITLNWTNPGDADFAGVRIKYSTVDYITTPGTSGVYEGTGTTFTHSNLTNGVTYYYTIFSKDEVPNWSATYAQVSSKAQDTTPPGPVTGLTITPDVLQNALSWTNPGDGDFAGVVIRRKTGSYPTGPTDGTSVFNGMASNYTDMGVSGNVLYYYAVYAKDGVPNYSTAAQGTGKPYSQQTVYTRNGAWNTSVTDTTGGSDSEANGASNMWKYEVVNATATSNKLSGASPWYKLAAESPATIAWDAANSRWAATHATYPRVNAVQLGVNMATGGHWWQPRGLWKAPRAGVATISGAIGFHMSSGGPNDSVEWAIGKRAGSTYTLLASSGASPVAITGTGTVVTVSLNSIPALQNISLNAGEELFWTYRGDVNNTLTSGYEWMHDSNPGASAILSITAKEY